MKCESCKKKNDCIGYGKTPVCGAYVSEKNPTHGDKIRSMSDEELAELFTNVTDDIKSGSSWDYNVWIDWLTGKEVE